MKEIAKIVNAVAETRGDGTIFVRLIAEVDDVSSMAVYASYGRYNDILRVQTWQDSVAKTRSKKKGRGLKSVFFEVPPGNHVEKMIVYSEGRDLVRDIK